MRAGTGARTAGPAGRRCPRPARRAPRRAAPRPVARRGHAGGSGSGRAGTAPSAASRRTPPASPSSRTSSGRRNRSSRRGSCSYRYLLPFLLDVVRGALEDVDDAGHRGGTAAPPPGSLVGDARDSREGLVQVAHGAAGEVAHGVAHPVEDVFHRVAILLEELLALGGDVVHLLAALLDHPDVALVFEQLQRGIDRARRRRVRSEEHTSELQSRFGISYA